MRAEWLGSLVLLAVAAFLPIAPRSADAQAGNPMDPSLTELGYIPLPDLGPGTYTRDGHTESGGLYPGGRPIRPPEFEAAVLEISKSQIQPLDAQGNPDPENGKIVLMSAGMSNTNIFLRAARTSPTRHFTSGRRTIPHAIRNW